MSNLSKPLGRFKPSKSLLLIGAVMYLISLFVFELKYKNCLIAKINAPVANRK